MRVLHFNTYESQGGAASAAYQLHKSLQNEGVESFMAVKFKNSSDPSVFQIGKDVSQNHLIQKIKRSSFAYFVYGKLRDANKILLKRKNLLPFNPNYSDKSLGDFLSVLKDLDIILIHWTDGFLSPELISEIQNKTKIPILWMLQDTEPLTGGCHYPLGCDGFKKKCGSCPQLNSNNQNDKSRKIWERKNKFLKPLNITFLAPTFWTKDRLKESSLFKEKPFEEILLGVNEKIFKKIPAEAARQSLGLPKDKKIIFFGSQDLKDERKGMQYLIESLKKLHSKLSASHPEIISSIFLVSAGRESLESEFKKYFDHKYLGLIKSNMDLASAYQSADIFACPSIEDAGPMMINESIACGTPVVAFDMGVARNLINDAKRGYVAKLKDADDFALGLYRMLTETKAKDWQAEEVNSSIVAKKYIALFEKIIS